MLCCLSLALRPWTIYKDKNKEITKQNLIIVSCLFIITVTFTQLCYIINRHIVTICSQWALSVVFVNRLVQGPVNSEYDRR